MHHIHLLAYFQQILESIFLSLSCFMLSSEHSPTLILLRRPMKVLSSFWLIFSGSSAIKKSDHKLKRSPNVIVYFWNIWIDLIGGNCNKSSATIMISLQVVDFLGSWIFHNLSSIWSRQIFGTTGISSIITTDTSKHKLRRLPLSQSESLGRVYPFAFDGIHSLKLIVVPFILMAATPVGEGMRTLGWTGDT